MIPPLPPGPTGSLEQSAVERCLRVADAARAAGRADLEADALGGAAQLEPSVARRLAWARALARVDPHQARVVARSLADESDPSISAFARALADSEPPSSRMSDPELAERVLDARIAGRNGELLRDLAPRIGSLSDDMLHRLAEAYARDGDVRAAAVVWDRIRHARYDDGDGWSLVQGGPFAIRSVSAGPDGLTLVTSGPGPHRGGLAHVQLPDGAAWSRWLALPGTGPLGWFGPHRRALAWNTAMIELRDADSGAVIAARTLGSGDELRAVATASSAGLAALVRSDLVELVDASLVSQIVHPLATSEVALAALAPSGDRLALFDRKGEVRVVDTRTGRTSRLSPLTSAPMSAVWRADGRLLVVGEDYVARWIRADPSGRWAIRAPAGGYLAPVLASAMARAGTHVAVADEQGLTVFDVVNGATRRHERVWRGPQIFLDFSPDGRALVAVDAEAVVRHTVPDLAATSQWKIAGTRFDATAAPRDPVGAILALDPGGHRLYTARTDHRLAIWDLGAEPAEVARIAWPESRALLPGEPVFALSEHGTALALSRRGATKFTLVSDGSRVSTVSLGERAPRVLALAVNDAADKTIVATGDSLLLHGPTPRRLEGGILRPTRMAFAEGERLLQVHDENGYLVIWEIETGARLGLHGPADDLGTIDHDTAQIAYWSGPTLRVAPLAGDLPQPREYTPCGPRCGLQAASFTREGASIEWFAWVDGAERSAALNLQTGRVTPLAADASRLFGTYVHRRSSVTNTLNVHRRGLGRVLTLAVASDLTAWAAMTPGGVLDGHFTRPWALALRAAEGALYDLEPFMLLTRAPGMVPGLSSRGLPPACSVAL